MMFREGITDMNIEKKNSITPIFGYGEPQYIDELQNISIDGNYIEFIEETESKILPMQYEKAQGIQFVKIHIKINGKEFSNADPIILSSNRGIQRYYSWLEILRVNNKIAIIQRIANENGTDILKEQKWKIIWIDEQNNVTEEKLNHKNRAENPLAVKLINTSYVTPRPMGYYSDLLEVYPTIFYPIIYPIFILLIGISLIIISFFKKL